MSVSHTEATPYFTPLLLNAHQVWVPPFPFSSRVGFFRQQEANLLDHQTTVQADLWAHGIIQGGRKSGSPSLILSCRIGVSEKGSINLRLQVNMSPGHSSAPPKETTIGILAAAVSR